ncbi:DUF58 domain-containing protein [Filibacter tadaridae]|uniref:DUF58 domain-containing protein n=1 Tax=Filibacter tadaridae TaxID=2483811 RepID=A0A3P5WYV6_9BACL|nr:DUF58 domain-containing protein [Filibacter tadaridae]VDC24230.1 hypothetical protein FILTAD_01037 [Filibacter tadaridae]
MMKVARTFLSSGRIFFVLFIAVSAVVFAMFQGGKVSWTIFYVLFPFICYSILLFFYPLVDIKAERTIRTPNVQNGGKLAVSITVYRRIRFPLLYTVVTEQWEEKEIPKLAGEKLKRFFLWGFRKEVKWEYEIERMPRGEHVLQGVEVEVSDFFGWIKKKKFIPAKHTILVYPKTVSINYVPIDTQYDRGSMASPLNIVKDTTMATGVRNYQPGDRVTWIHWKSFARTQSLMTKEFEDKRSQELFLILDSRPAETFEGQVELAASILKESTSQQAGLTFMSTGAESSIFPFIQSEEQFHRALVHLAKIKPSKDQSDARLPGGEETSGHGGSIVLITGNPDWPFIQSVTQNVKNARRIVCFVVTQDGQIPPTLASNIQLAKSRGIAVHSLAQERFTTAFEEVTRL